MSPWQQNVSMYVPSDIDKWNHVFVRDDSVRGPLQIPYKCPFRFLSKTPKTFKIDINGHSEVVPISDRLKNAFYEPDTPLIDDPVTLSFNPVLPSFQTLLETNLHTHLPLLSQNLSLVSHMSLDQVVEFIG